MKNFIENGKQLNYTNPSSSVTIPGGSVVIVGAFAGVALGDILPLTQGVILVEGVVELAKTAGLAISQGDPVFYNSGTGLVTKTATDTPLGVATENALAGDAVARAKLYEVGKGYMTAVAPALLAQTTSGTYSQAQVQAIATQADAIVTALKASGLMA